MPHSLKESPFPTIPVPGLRGNPGLALMVAAAYLGLFLYVMFLNDPVNAGASFWPAAGLSLGVLLLVPRARWPWVLGAVLLSDLGAGLAWGYPPRAAVFWTLGNVAEPLLGALLIQSIAARRPGFRAGALVPVHNLLLFIGCGVIVAPLAGASLGSIGTIWGLGEDFWKVWPKYVVGDALGVLVVAPVLLGLREPALRRGRRETLVLAAGLLAISLLAFRNWGARADAILPFLVVPLLTWAALRYGVRGAAWSLLLTANLGNVATAFGFGPFALDESATQHAVTLFQIYLAIMGTTTLILATLVSDLVEKTRAQSVLSHKALHDPLTDMLNRAGLQERFDELRRRRRDAGVTVFMCDLDGLKAINDRHGHPVGDRVIVEVGRRIAADLREQDCVARLGGDEFVVLLEEEDARIAGRIAARLLENVARTLHGDFGRIRPALSVGIATGSAREGLQALLERADIALYEAKREGGARLRWSRPEEEAAAPA